MKTNREIKRTAWKLIRADVGKTAGSAFVAILLGGVSLFSFISLQVFAFFQSRLLHSGVYGDASRQMYWLYIGVLIYLIVSMFIGSVVEVGYDRFFLVLLHEDRADTRTLFYCMPVYLNALMLRFLMTVKALLWSVLLIVPGWAAMLNYSMAPFLMAQNPKISPPVALYTSKVLMRGYKMRLFRLLAGFIVEIILCFATCGVALIVVLPYMKAATAEFYRERVAEHDAEVLRLKAEAAERGELDDDDYDDDEDDGGETGADR